MISLKIVRVPLDSYKFLWVLLGFVKTSKGSQGWLGFPKEFIKGCLWFLKGSLSSLEFIKVLQRLVKCMKLRGCHLLCILLSALTLPCSAYGTKGFSFLISSRYKVAD